MVNDKVNVLAGFGITPSALHAVAGSFEERPAAEKPAGHRSSRLTLKSTAHPKGSAFVIAKPHPIG